VSLGVAGRGGVTAVMGTGGVVAGGSGWEGAGAGPMTAGGGAVAHPAIHSAASTPLNCLNRCLSPAMILILLEAALAGALLVFIVWWTMFDKPKKKD